MRLGVYIGSFDPVHKGHIGVVNTLLSQNYVDKIIIAPILYARNKKIKASLEDRIKMLKYYENPSVSIDEKNNCYKYTYQILDSIQSENVNDEIYFIMGDDLLSNFCNWRYVEKILKYKIIVMKRSLESIEFEASLKNFDITIVEKYEYNNISSTFIQNNISKIEVTKLLDEKIYEYIQNNNLYKIS